jgi:hypothetical protein
MLMAGYPSEGFPISTYRSQEGHPRMMVGFLPVNVDFRPETQTVHLKGACKGRNFDVQISRATLGFLIGAKKLNKETAEAAVSRNRDRLQRAAAIALSRSGQDCRDIVIELDDYIVTRTSSAAPRQASGRP